jgi:hypothetical protein
MAVGIMSWAGEDGQQLDNATPSVSMSIRLWILSKYIIARRSLRARTKVGGHDLPTSSRYKSRESHPVLDIGIKMRYTLPCYREGNSMNFITFVLFWYAIAFGLFLIHVAWAPQRSRAYIVPQEPVLALKEGQTIVGVADRPDGIQFYTEMDVVDGKS